MSREQSPDRPVTAPGSALPPGSAARSDSASPGSAAESAGAAGRYEQLRQAMTRCGDPSKAVQMAAYMKNRFSFYGIQTPARRAIYNELLKQERRAKRVDWLLLDLCWQDPGREMQYFVCDYLLRMKRFLIWDDVPRLEQYVRSRQWWDTIDVLTKVIGTIGRLDARIGGLMLRWAADPDLWVRRTAIEHQLGWKAQTDTALLSQILEACMGTEEFFINKAMGWALRDYSKTDPDWVRNFIEEHVDDLNALTVREGSKYLTW